MQCGANHECLHFLTTLFNFIGRALPNRMIFLIMIGKGVGEISQNLFSSIGRARTWGK